jgi:hypothetical protein
MDRNMADRKIQPAPAVESILIDFVGGELKQT